MGVFDGDVTRIRALVPSRYGGEPYTAERFVWTEREAKNTVAGFKGRGAKAVMVDELHYVVHHRADLSFGEDWEE